METDCKSVGFYAYAGSNPALPTIFMLKDHLQIGKLYSLHLWQGDKPLYCQMLGFYPEGSISVYHIKDLEHFCEVPYKNITVNPSHISMIRREYRYSSILPSCNI